ncbi:MAG: tyrosine-type recombinase/integrase [Treponemataceae bacterium]|nr:tyrosine-type recombinase/integrase [Treponemataceae bacterium]
MMDELLSKISSVEDAAEEFLVYLSGVRSVSSNTVKGYGNDYKKLAELLGKQIPSTNCNSDGSSGIPLEAVETEHLRQCLGALVRQKLTPASVNRFVAAVRSLFAYCYRLEYIYSNPALELKTVKNPVRLPDFMTEKEADELCSEPEIKPLLWPARDEAMFKMFYSSGCRISEIAGLKMRDIRGNYNSAIVHGKGNKDRVVFFSPEAVDAFKKYLLERKEHIKSEKPVRSVFISQRGNGLSVRGIYSIVSRYSSVEGTNRHVSPHSFRHSFATTMLNAGADIRVVQEMLGHSSISTTQRYTHVTAAKLVDIYNRAHPHGKER